jgi:hypothetical protein
VTANNSAADCASGRCTVDGSSTAFNYYYQGAYRSCGPANRECYSDGDCLKACRGGKWGGDGPASGRTLGSCLKGSKDEGCAGAA